MYANSLIIQPTFKIILDKSWPKKDIYIILKFLITLNSVQKYYPIGMDLSVSDFQRIQNNSVRKEQRFFVEKNYFNKYVL